MKNRKKNICVFCSSSNRIDKRYFDAADQLGVLIGKNEFNLIHGGGMIGLMNQLSKAVQANGGKVTGVVPERLNRKGIVSETDDRIVVTNSMAERKQYMREKACAFIALPGGFGTLEEISEVITLKQLQYYNKPVVFVNTDHFFDSLLNWFDLLFSRQFVKPFFKDIYYVAENPQQAMEYILEYKMKKYKGPKYH